MTRNLRLLALVAGVIVAVVLYLAFGRGKHAASKAGDPPAAGSATVAGGPAGSVQPRVTPRGAGSGADPGADPGQATDPTADAGAAAPTRTYVMDDGTLVRDHRRNGEPPVATSPLPPGQRTLDPTVSAAVYQQVQPRVAACGASVPAGARGPDPFVYVNLTVAIAGGALTATDVVPVAHDVDEAAAGALVSCVREGLSTLRADAKGQPDQAQYVLQYPVRLR